MRQRLARRVLRVTGWKVLGGPPQRGVIVAAPHTSNWDFVLAVLVMWNAGAPLRVLMKREVFRGPFAPLLRRLGGVAVDRARPAGIVRDLIASARAEAPFLLVIAAEGTRSKGDRWKSGFYRIAQDADLPVVLVSVDGPTRTIVFGPILRPTGDVAADMDAVRAFYADKRGLRPERRTEPRLREEGPHDEGA